MQRPDDTEAAIRTRLERYHDMTKPLIAHYAERGALATFRGTESDVIYPDMHAHVKKTILEL